MQAQYTYPPLSERFWAKVNKDGPVPAQRPELGPCWLWTSQYDTRGYGKFRQGNKRRKYHIAHRWAYLDLIGAIPAGLELDHLCKTHACVNPSHLEPVTHAENCRRGSGWAGKNSLKTHCKRGHEFTPENTISRPLGRECRQCAVDRRRVPCN